MDEIDIKVEVLAWLRRACRGRALPVVASEFSLNGTGIRADLAVLGETFSGIEIKSAADTLRRLPNQLEGYARYFEQTILIIAPKHERGVAGLDIRDAEVWSVEAPKEHKLIKNGAARIVSGHTLLGLLTAQEERRALRSIGAHNHSSNDPYRAEFEAIFRQRYGTTSDAFWQAVRGRPIRREDLNLLSRFFPERQRLQAAHQAEDAKWMQWAKQMNAIAAVA